MIFFYLLVFIERDLLFWILYIIVKNNLRSVYAGGGFEKHHITIGYDLNYMVFESTQTQLLHYN